MPSLFQPTTISFGEAKNWVAAQYSKQAGTSMITRAGQAIQRAVADWNKYNWEWNMVTATDIAVTAGTSEYTLPYDFRDLYCATLTSGGSTVTLASDSFRNFIRSNPEQDRYESSAYDLVRRGSTGKLVLMSPPDRDGTLSNINYYRRMVMPCALTATGTWSQNGVTALIVGGTLSGGMLGNLVQTTATGGPIDSGTTVAGLDPNGLLLTVNQAFPLAGTNIQITIGGDDTLLDIPEDHVWALLARAAEHFIASVNGPEKLIAYWAAAARAGLVEAKAATQNRADRVVKFYPARWGPNYNPNRVYD